ncbi:S-layer homology domain-containing protein [Paenibacillus sp. UNC451MF]|uniref:S-layer homology domain-containing protein n=1 Tax=Paenibacillus sp. UNC451MF TaxID=1449063 RepID=UPI00068DDD6F|nr:S-layer homology domain-containing protein [Paenibacillus sp. UNC451MF]
MNIQFKKIAVSALVAAIAVTTPALPYLPQSYVPTAHAAVASSDYIVRMLFDNNFTDSSSNPLTATAVGNPTFVNGRIGNAINLQKTSSVKQYVNLGKPASLQMGTNKNFTLAFWIKSPGLTSDPAIISNKNWSTGGNTGYAVVLKNSTLSWNYRTAGESRLDADIPNVADGSWHHIVISHDRATGRVDFYKDGSPVTVTKVRGNNYNNIASTMDIQGLTGTLDANLDTNIGNDGTGNYDSNLDVTLDDVQILGRAITAQEAADIYNQAPPVALDPFNGTFSLIGAQHAVQGSQFHFNLDLRTPTMSTRIDKLDVDLAYDSHLFEFASVTNATYIDASTPGHLKLKLTGGKVFNQTNPLEFAKSTVAELTFNTKAAAGQGTFQVSDAQFYNGTTPLVIESLNKPLAAVQVHSKETEDVNQDGYITVGDIALAPADQEDVLAKIADKVKYQPYKHVVVIGIDGGGASITSKAPYWETLSSTKEEVGSRLSIPAIRSIVEKGAVSYTAQTTLPTVSSPNWGSMVTGVDYSKHKIANYESGNYTYSETSPYPTVFKKLREALPATKQAAFVTWSNVFKGHIEPSVGVEATMLGDEADAAAFAQYAASGKFNDTSLAFFQFDDVDHAGHSYGFYTKKYYEQWTKTDKNVETIYKALQNNHLLDDTLIVLLPDHGGGVENPDHTLGGNPLDHAIESPLSKTIFFAANGRTVATDTGKEKLLQGGTTKDLAATILTALGVDQPIGDSKVIDGMFVPQKDQNNANASNLKLTKVTDTTTHSLKGFELSLDQVTSNAKAIDLQLATSSLAVKSIEPAQAGVKVLRNDSANGTTRIVLSSATTIQPDAPIVKIQVEANSGDASAQLQQAMVADAQGKETLPNLTSASKEESSDVAVTGIEVSSKQVNLVEGQSTELTATIVPANATNKKVTWTTSNAAVATVEAHDGKALVTGLSEGTATITAVTENGNFKSESTVKVSRPSSVDLLDLKINGKTLDGFEADKLSYTLSVPNSTTVAEVTYKLADSRAAVTVTGGEALAVGDNLVEIDVNGPEARHKQYTIVVNRANAELSSNTDLLDLKVNGETVPGFTAGQLSYTLFVPRSTTVAQVTYQAADSRAAVTIAGGDNLMIGSNTVTVTVKAQDGTKKLYTINVIRPNSSSGHSSGSSGSTSPNPPEVIVTPPIETKPVVPETSKPTEPTKQAPIKDMEGHWAQTKVEQAISLGWIQGYPNGTFLPDQSVTKAEFAVLLVRALKLKDQDIPLSFTDTDRIGDWAKQEVAILTKSGIVGGYEDGSFQPDKNITRAEMIVMIIRALDLQDKADGSSTFADHDAIQPWAASSVALAERKGLIQGYPGNLFAPDNNASRAEAVTMLLRTLETVK